jgi:hypothetical protein
LTDCFFMIVKTDMSMCFNQVTLQQGVLKKQYVLCAVELLSKQWWARAAFTAMVCVHLKKQFFDNWLILIIPFDHRVNNFASSFPFHLLIVFKEVHASSFFFFFFY